jgi:hypothetical protein
MIDPFSLPSVPMVCRKQLPTVPCIYFAIDALGQIQYIGKSVNPRQRWTQHHRQSQVKECRIAYLECDAALLDKVEQALIQWLQPVLNGTVITTDKRKISAYLPDDLKEDADKLAESESRSLSNLIEVLLKQAVEKAKAEGRIH